VNFSVAGVSPPSGVLGILADFQFRTPEGHLCGAFVFERAGLLAGLEVWSIDGLTVPSTLPAIEKLESLEAVSKLSKGDHQAGDLQEGQEHLGLALVSDDQSAEVSEPGHGPFDRPSAAVAA
jgi:hypothetical protein